MWIIKLGGSLQDSEYLQPWLDAVIEHGRGRAVLVPGGGRFADAVREAQRRFGFDDAEAHRAAVRAMEDYAALLRELAPSLLPARSTPEIRAAVEAAGVPVWLPAAMVNNNPDIPETWEVTSDSLALWLAQRLSARGLILVKSVAVDAERSPEELAGAGILDGYFPNLIRNQPVSLGWAAPGHYGSLAELLD